MKTAFTDHRQAQPDTAPGARVSQPGFTLMEVLVAMGLMSLIVFVLMSVFSSTQSAFRAGVTQTDVLAGGRTTMDQIATDIRALTPSAGFSNGAVNVYITNNSCLVMSLPASANYRSNILQSVFLLSKQNTEWVGAGYTVVATNTSTLFPLYRYSAMASLQQGPYLLFSNFNAALYNNSLMTNSLYWSHVMDGVVHLTMRAYDQNGVWITNGYGHYNQQPYILNTVCNYPQYGEMGFTMFSNNLPSSMDVQLGVLEDTALRRLQSMVNVNYLGYSNYLATNSANKMQLFRQHVTVLNCDPSAYQ